MSLRNTLRIIAVPAILLLMLTFFSCTHLNTAARDSNVQNVDRVSPLQFTPVSDHNPSPIGKTDKEIMETVEAHAQQPFLPKNKTWHVKFSSTSNDIDDQTVLGAGSGALGQAATCYAVATLDFDVSFGDLIDSGFWPYQLPRGVSRDATMGTVRTAAIPIKEFSGQSKLLTNVGSADWLLENKALILSLYYKDFGVEDTKVDTGNQLIRYINPNFWVNPYSGQAMKQSSAKGDYQLSEIGSYNNAKDSPGYYPLEVPFINISDLGQFGDRGASDEHCCKFVFQSSQNIWNVDQEYDWCCTCHGTKYCCHLKFKFECLAAKSEWIKVGPVDCTYHAGPGECVRGCGQHAPDTQWVGQCAPTWIEGEHCDFPPCDSQTDPGWVDCSIGLNNFRANLNTAFGGAAPGPLCDCSS